MDGKASIDFLSWFARNYSKCYNDLTNMFGRCITPPGGGVLDFGLDGGVPPGPWDPNPCLE